MVTYPNMNMTSSDGLLNLFNYVNEQSDGIFTALILLAVFLIIFLTTIQRTNASKALTFASFVSFMIAIPLTILDMLAQKYLYMTILILGFSTLWLILDNDQ